MADLEKVIKGLECCAAGCKSGCPYGTDEIGCETELETDALALIKKQAAYIKELSTAPAYVQSIPFVKVVQIEQTVTSNVCENCGTHMLHAYKFCPVCGRKVKWDD